MSADEGKSMPQSESPQNVSPAGPAITPVSPAVTPSAPAVTPSVKKSKKKPKVTKAKVTKSAKRPAVAAEPNIIAVPKAFDDYYGAESTAEQAVVDAQAAPVEVAAELSPKRTAASREARSRMALEPPAIEVIGLRKEFGDTVAVDGVSLIAEAGTVLAVLGPNGAGKTTTVNMLTTLLRPDDGVARVAGFDVVKEAAKVRASIALTGQFAALDEELSGRANLVLFGRLHGLAKSAAQARADELIEQFDLVDAADRQVAKYSGGMRRRIDIACGLVVKPRVFFLDEPTTGLDPRSRQEVWSLIEQLKDEGVTVLLTTQYLEEADLLSDYIVVIDHGKVIASGTAEQLKAATGGTVCSVTPARAADLPRLAEAVADLLPPDGSGVGETSIGVPAASGTDILVEVVRRTTAAGIDLADISMQSPSLDDVFLKLTGPDRATG
ncbi:MAG: ATP-binding cassette domain-containing protein [Gordonia sp. (in: high G+C Gram-positive bacteria)]|uniref:ATP-binding cassette domain-containing protein n=1 Tax=Gordonia sp. (in: high G+C Gram-positive bacteria) TaxID=84139 RepID=UPI0039E71FCD